MSTSVNVMIALAIETWQKRLNILQIHMQGVTVSYSKELGN
jgi:hypothetical protein